MNEFCETNVNAQWFEEISIQRNQSSVFYEYGIFFIKNVVWQMKRDRGRN